MLARVAGSLRSPSLRVRVAGGGVRSVAGRPGPEADRGAIEALLPGLRTHLLAYLRRHLPQLEADHEDLVQETLAGVVGWARRGERRKLPAPEAKALATVILKRRVADLFRVQARQWALHQAIDPKETSPTGPDARQLLLTRALRCAVAFLADADPEDRELVTLLVGESSWNRPLTAGERKRLQRLRGRLRTYILEHLGDSVSEILGDELDE